MKIAPTDSTPISTMNQVIHQEHGVRVAHMETANSHEVRATALSLAAARLALATAAAVLLLLAGLHVLSPEFDPSWRAVSEYALGSYGWVLSLMFIAWAISSWALVVTLWSQLRTITGKIGLFFLMASGIGEAMASVFDVTHSLHGLAGLIGVPTLPIAAMLISVSLARKPGWSEARKALLWTANLTWISFALLAVAMIHMMSKFTETGGKMSPEVFALGGYANRLLVVVYCAWLLTVAWLAIRLQTRVTAK
jgi:hypothetical protein